MNRPLFGSSGIRGPADSLFSNQLCFDLGRAFAQFLEQHDQKGAIAVGMDPRESSPRIRAALILGLAEEGWKILDQGTAPIPAINYILKIRPDCAGSVMVTGSHVEPSLNGLKFFAFGEEILKEHEKEIEAIYLKLKEKKKFEEREIKVEESNQADEGYQEMLVQSAKTPFPKWRAVLDAGNGAQSDTMPPVLKRLGLTLIEMNTTIQGQFYSRDTEVEGDFKDLQERVKKEGADFGIGYDSDGDRVVFIDEKGVFIPGDYTGSLVAQHLPGETVVTPINVSQVVDYIGKKVIRTKVGSPYVVAKMKELDLPFGFEANGGGIFKEMRSRDGGRMTIEVLNILAKSKQKLSQLIGQLPKFYLYRDKVDYRWELKERITQAAKEEFKGVKIEELDGLKIWLDKNEWILFRSSSNAPEFRVFTESQSDRRAKELLEQGLSFVKKIVNQN